MHKGANRRIPGRLVSTRWVQANGVRMARRIQEEILIHAAKLTGGRQ